MMLCQIQDTYRLLILIGLLAGLLPAARAAAPTTGWPAVDKAIESGLPKTALELLEPITKRALAQRAWGEAAQAICQRIQLESEIQGGQIDEVIPRLTRALNENPKELQPILQAVLAHSYWTYFQENRWRFLQRSRTVQPPSSDFRTWDLSRLFQEIDRQFKAALANNSFLKSTPVASFNGVLKPGTVPDSYRPTLYDFIAHEALRFYTSGEQAAAAPGARIDWPADAPVYGLIPLFGSATEFAQAAKIERRLDESMEEKALFLFRDLILFHLPDGDPSARLDVDLARLQWAANVATGEAKSRLHQEALTRFAEAHRSHVLSSKALFHLAESFHAEGNWTRAHAIAREARDRHPRSPGAALSQALLQSIEAPNLQLSAERVWLPDGTGPRSPLQITYRNLTNVSLKVIPYSWTNHLQSPGFWDQTVQRRLLALAPLWKGTYALPVTTNFQESTLELAQPSGVAPGFYVMVASPDPGFSESKGPLSFATVWISDLALVTRPRPGRIEGFVLDAVSGDPIPNASVRFWRVDPQRRNLRLRATVATDELGVFQSKDASPGQGELIEVVAGNRRIGSFDGTSWYPVSTPQTVERTFLFTDRALYRPGQSIHYKGIRVQVDAQHDQYQLAKGSTVTVVFSDVNGQEIARQSHRVNDFGSFAGTFISPKDRLLGSMSLHDEAHPDSRVSVSVEEYKRPKFQVSLAAPQDAVRLGEAVTVEGRALTFTGVPVASAQATWQVTRMAEFPNLPYFRRGIPPPSASALEELARGELQTDADGHFRIEFRAKPDPRVAKTHDPIFAFRVQVDITDSNGETRSEERTVRIGYQAAKMMGSIAEWQTPAKPVQLQVTCQSLEDAPLPLEGALKVYQLRQPESVIRPKLAGRAMPYSETARSSVDLSQPENWPIDNLVREAPFRAAPDGRATSEFVLEAGAYRAIWSAQDRYGARVTTESTFFVVSPASRAFPIKVPQYVAANVPSLEPGQTYSLLWGTGYAEGRAFVEIEHRNEVLQRFWTPAGATQHGLTQAITEALRGGFTVRITQIRENRALLATRNVEVPWSNKDLDLRWEHFVNRLEPGKPETWTLKVTPHLSTNTPAGSEKESLSRAFSEMAATLYDASLDAIRPHSWVERFGVFAEGYSYTHSQFNNAPEWLQHFAGNWPEQPDPGLIEERYRHLAEEALTTSRRFRLGTTLASPRAMQATAAADATLAVAPPGSTAAAGMERGSFAKVADAAVGGIGGAKPPPSGAATSPLASVSPRRNLSESAFFFPQILSDSNGTVRLSFTMPEALTEWRFLAFAHDQNLRSGSLEARAVSRKEIMVQPNPPRFVREGDALEFPVKVSNSSESRQRGRVRLQFKVALDDRSADRELQNTRAEMEFNLEPKESRSFVWRIRIPDGMGFLTYQAVAATERWSDGEAGYLPVLSRKLYVTESLPLPIRGPGTQEFRFESLLRSAQSRSLIHQGLKVQVVSQPAWYAVLALPYLMEFPHECSEQTFNRLYANSLARHVLHSDPKIRTVFDQWRGTPALQSPLEKNQDLKSVLIEETPWLREAQNESESRRRLGELFAPNRVESETQRLIQQLQEMQLSDGRWPWFPGGPGNDFITLYIATGTGRLRHLGVDLPIEGAVRAFGRLDAWIAERHRWTLQHGKKQDHPLDATIALYLYGRSFFLKEAPIPPASTDAIAFWLEQARRDWVRLGERMSQGHVALALLRWGESTTPQAIVKSLRERSVSSPEFGMFWRDTEAGWGWQQAPIETQALMIEVFEEVAHDANAVDECQVWLLKQKQTQAWKTTKATADAVYALLLRGTSALSSESRVEVRLGGKPVERAPVSSDRSSIEPGTGFYERSISAADIRPAHGSVTLTKPDAGVAWASIHWQYLEDISKIAPHARTPLSLKKALFVRRAGGQGSQLVPLTGVAQVGDEVVIRLELRVDRDVEFVHLKDQRGSGLEPVNALSSYKYQDGLGYYESTRDTATHFFLDYLAKGTYVFEYSARIQHAGQYQSGIAEIQCLYAPEFNSHSESTDIRAQPR